MLMTMDLKRQWMNVAIAIAPKGFWAVIASRVVTASFLIFDVPVSAAHTESPSENARSRRHYKQYSQTRPGADCVEKPKVFLKQPRAIDDSLEAMLSSFDCCTSERRKCSERQMPHSFI